MKKIFVFFTSLSLLLGSLPMPLSALAAVMGDQGGPPAGVQNGPSAQEISQFEQEMGAPPTAFGSAPTQPDIASVQSLPVEIKQYASDKELVDIYCAMTKWKSGDFFSAMDALQKYMAPAIQQIKDLGVEIDMPDTAAIRAEGQKRIDAICSASTIGQAESLANDFQTWGQGEARDKFSNQLRQSIEEKMKNKGDQLRDKVRTEVKGFADSEAKAMQDELQQLVDKLVEQKKAAIEASAKSNPGGVEAMVAQAKNEVNAQVQTLVDQKTAKMKEAINAKVNEIIGPQKKQFEDIGQALNDVGGKIDQEIAANRGQYDQYKNQAFTLRKALVFNMLDKNMAEGLAQLDAGSVDIEAAREKDPTIKSVAEIKISLAEDRMVLETKLGAALEAGDDAAFEQILLDFKTRWESYRTEMEKVAKQSVGKACAAATAQFAEGRTQIDIGAKQIKDLQQKCAGVASDECLATNQFADRFNTILGKFSDIKVEMSVAEKMCAAPEQADKNSLIAVMKKLQTDAEDLKIYGQAMEADKQKALADSAQKICSQVLPQLNATQAEIQKNDMVVLKNNLDRCAGKNTEECQSVNALRGDYGNVVAAEKNFSASKEQVVKFCAGSANKDDLMQISAVLGNLKNQGDEIRSAAKTLEAKQAEKVSAKSFCKAVSGSIGMAVSGLMSGLKELTTSQSSCSGKNDEQCQAVNSMSDKFTAIKNNINASLKKGNEINTACASADTKPPSDDLIKKAESFKKDEADIKNAAANLRAAIDKAGLNGSGSVSFEAEGAVSFNIRTGVSNPMVRENSPRWRPPFFGNGDWYMGAGGDYLNYNFNVPASGKYNIWVRDYTDRFQPRGVRRIVVEFDGKRYGVFGENSGSAGGDKGAFAWHKIGDGAALTKGAHKMKITKEASTVGAAVLDAFYFTTGAETPKEK